MFDHRRLSPPTQESHCVYGLSGRGRRSNLVSLTMGVASHMLSELEETDAVYPSQSATEENREDSDLGEAIHRITALLHEIVDFEVRRRERASDLRGGVEAGPSISPAPCETWKEGHGGATTESDMAVTERSDGPVTGDDFGRIDAPATGSRRTSPDVGLVSLTPFILSMAFECPFGDLRNIYKSAVLRMRDELNMQLPDPREALGGCSARTHWLSHLEGTVNGPVTVEDLRTKARYFVTHGQLPSHIRVVFGHWSGLAEAHISTIDKLLFSEEGPLALSDRLVCALIAAAVHQAEGLTRFLCAVLLRNGSIERHLGREGGSRSNSVAGDRLPEQGCSRDLVESLLLADSWPVKYSTPRRVCTILARKPWSLRRSDLDPILDHWSEPELIHMLSIFSYFLGLSSLLAMLKIPCDPSNSFEIAEVLGLRLGYKLQRSGSPSETSSHSDECSPLHETQSVSDAFWSLSEPVLSNLINGNENKDVMYQKRITKGGADCTLTTSMFSFDEGARSILDIFFPTLADDLSHEFSVLESILNGEGCAEPGVGQRDSKVVVFDALKLAPKPSNMGAGLTTPPSVQASNACTFNAVAHVQPDLRVLDVSDARFWEACRYYSMNVVGVVDLSYNYCDINLNVGKFAKAFALAATMQPESDPSDASYGDPAIRPKTYEEEECILALGLCAMYAKIEALLLRGLSIVR